MLVDEHLQTSVPGIYAAGDIANAEHPFYGSACASSTGRTRSTRARSRRTTCSASRPFDKLPFFYSDQYDTGMEYSGFTRSWDKVVFRGDPAAREFIAFWLQDGRVVAGMNMNIWDVNEQLQELIPAAR